MSGMDRRKGILTKRQEDKKTEIDLNPLLCVGRRKECEDRSITCDIEDNGKKVC